MVDVGGQRSERKRWFECFDSVTSILFLVSSSEFDQVLMEDRQTNRLTESLNIFETIVNNRVFSNVSIILFLNKTDLLEEKVKKVSIKDYFPEFEGDPHCLTDVQKFLVDCFRTKRRDQQQKPLYHHFTTAINTENIRLVFRDVKDTILHDNLKQLMLQWCAKRQFYLSNFCELFLVFLTRKFTAGVEKSRSCQTSRYVAKSCCWTHYCQFLQKFRLNLFQCSFKLTPVVIL